jgi:hypothetical protein
MIEKAKEKKRFLMEACFSRFFPVWAEVRKVMDQKTLGEVTAVHANLAHNDYVVKEYVFWIPFILDHKSKSISPKKWIYHTRYRCYSFIRFWFIYNYANTMGIP